MNGGSIQDMKIKTEHLKEPVPNHKEQTIKLDLSLVPPIAIAHEAAALMAGANKHGRDNYRESLVNSNVYLSAAQRHISLWASGQDVDDEGIHHLGAARACLGILLDAWENGNLVDNRYRSTYPDVLSQLNELMQPGYELTEAGEELLKELGE